MSSLPAGTILKSDSHSTLAVVDARANLHVTAIRVINTTAADIYAQLFDAAATTSVTLGTTKADWVVQADANDPSVGDGLPSNGVIFKNGIVAACTTANGGATTATAHLRIVIL